ncbi:MAG: exodeoxyribonuclease VII small subunit [Rhodovibrionaceae bacterium]|nr:exodeoxyribonuclease VII small subunit [Rhodovibrionaceae bacterium]
MSKDESIPEDIQKMSFEEALEELKGIVERLERGEEKLEESIENYQRGAALKKHCEDKLKQAQERIDKITLGPGGEVGTEPLDVE